MNKEKLLAHLKSDVPGLTRPNTAFLIAQSALRFGMQPLTTREADDLWLECTKKHKRPGPAQLIEAFCELRSGTPMPAEYEPYDMAELRALTAMHAGAPWCEEILPELMAIFSIADQLRRQNKRPVDPACGGEVWPS